MILHYILWLGILFKYHVKMMCEALSNNITGVTSGSGTGNPSGAPECPHPHPRFSVIRVAQSLVFCVVFVDHCLACCPFLLAIEMSVLVFAAFDNPFGIFKNLSHFRKFMCGQLHNNHINCSLQTFSLDNHAFRRN